MKNRIKEKSKEQQKGIGKRRAEKLIWRSPEHKRNEEKNRRDRTGLVLWKRKEMEAPKPRTPVGRFSQKKKSTLPYRRRKDLKVSVCSRGKRKVIVGGGDDIL